MALTESRLRQIIREEAAKVMGEGRFSRRGGGGGGGYGGGYGGGGSRDEVQHLMDRYGLSYEDAEQRLQDIYDDIGFDQDLVDDAVFGGEGDD
jgi:hypothetical protein